MKRSTLALFLVAALAAGTAQPALAAAKKPAPKPITKTYYFHGTGNGNASAIQSLNNDTGGILPMDAVKPTATSDSDYGMISAANNPNHECYGNALTMHAAWTGVASGTLTDKVVVSFYARATPGNATVQLFADVGTEIQCNEEYPLVLAEATVPLPASPTFQLVTATLTLRKPVKVKSSFSIQIQNENVATPQASDIGFDSVKAPSAATWTCLPNAGKKSC